jgi:hypothetical protein
MQEFCKRIDDLWKYIEAVVEGEANQIVTAYLEFASGLNVTFVQSVEDLFGQFREKWVSLLAFSIDIGVERLWPQIVESVSNKASRMRKIEAKKGRFSNQDIVDNISGAIKSSIYCHIRSLYGNDGLTFNRSLRSAIFFFVREYSYAAMFHITLLGNSTFHMVVSATIGNLCRKSGSKSDAVTDSVGLDRADGFRRLLFEAPPERRFYIFGTAV